MRPLGGILETNVLADPKEKPLYSPQATADGKKRTAPTDHEVNHAEEWTMVAPAIIAAGISAAAAIGSSVKASNDASSATSGSAARALDFYKMQQQTSGAHLPYLVDNAKAAGLHPLFALGTSGTFSPSYGGQGGGGKSGSYIGEGIAQAGGAIARGVTGAARQKETSALHALRLQKAQREIKLDDMEILKRASDLKMAEQNPMWGDTDTGLGSESKLYPYGTKMGPPLSARPLKASPRTSVPLWSEVVGPGGRRTRVMNPEMGMDEIGQIEFIRQQAQDWAADQLMQRRRAAQRHRRNVRKRRKTQDYQFPGGS